MNEERPTLDEGNLPITNTLFPPPPSYYQAFTDINLARYAELRSKKGKERADGANDNSELSDKPLSAEDGIELIRLEDELEKPNGDWVNEDGRWMCFGQLYTVSDVCSYTYSSRTKCPSLRYYFSRECC